MTRPIANATLGPDGRRWKVAVFVTLICATGLAGCNVSPYETASFVPDDYRTRHPIVLEEALATVDIPAGAKSGRLAPDAYANVAAFGDRFRRSGSSVLAIVAPSGSANEIAAHRVAGEIRLALVSSGVPSEAIDFRVYAASPRDTGAPVRLAYNRIAARTDQCGRWPDRVELTSENRNYENFGCATQQNLAAIVDNPLDLVYPRETTPADAERRSTVLEKYRQGTPYQTDYSRESGRPIAGVGG